MHEFELRRSTGTIIYESVLFRMHISKRYFFVIVVCNVKNIS